ncbi:unnamed protein product [Closterium sp. NIES-53]
MTSPLISLTVSPVSTPTAVPLCFSHLSHWSPTPPWVAPLPPHGPAPSDVSQRVAVDSGAAGGGTTGGVGSGGSECPLGTGGTGGIGAGGPSPSRQEALSLERLREWAVQWSSPGGGASRLQAGGAGTTGAGGAGVVGAGGYATGAARPTRAGVAGTPGAAGGAGGAAAMGAAAGSPGGGAGRAAGGTGDACATGGTRGTGSGGASTGGPGVGRVGGTGTGGGADTGGTPGVTGVGGASWQESLSLLQLREWAIRWGSPGGGAGGTGSGGVVATGAGGSGVRLLSHSRLRFVAFLSQPQLLPGSLLPAPAPHTEVTASLTARREPKTHASTPERREPETRASISARVRRARRPRAPAVPSTHDMTLHPSSVPQHVVLPSTPVCSLPHVPDPESDLVRAASPTVTRLLDTIVTDASFESAAASALVVELLDFAALCHLDYAASLIFDSSYPPSVGGELALGCDGLEDRQFELECLAATAPHLASTLLCP